MKKQNSQNDSWWHERPTKAADLGDFSTEYRSIYDLPRKQESIWPKAAMVVALMFGLALALGSMIAS